MLVYIKLISMNTKKEKTGFTLVELLVVIAVILTITGAVVINYRRGGRIDLQRTVVDISQKVREVEEMALASEEVNGSVPSGGYGVYFNSSDPDTYIIFADEDGDGSYDGAGERVREEKIGSNVEIFNIIPSDPVSIIFVPPEPKVKIDNDYSNRFAEITFKRGNEMESIYINKIGLISIN